MGSLIYACNFIYFYSLPNARSFWLSVRYVTSHVLTNLWISFHFYTKYALLFIKFDVKNIYTKLFLLEESDQKTTF